MWTGVSLWNAAEYVDLNSGTLDARHMQLDILVFGLYCERDSRLQRNCSCVIALLVILLTAAMTWRSLWVCEEYECSVFVDSAEHSV